MKKRKIPNYEDKVLTKEEKILLKRLEWLKIKEKFGQLSRNFKIKKIKGGRDKDGK